MCPNRSWSYLLASGLAFIAFFLPMAHAANTSGPDTMLSSSFETGERPLPQVLVNPALPLLLESQPGFDDDPDRPLVRMRSASLPGNGFHFVENEIYLITDDPEELGQLQGRWPGTVVFELPLDAFGTGANGLTLYLLEVDPSGADIDGLGASLSELAPELFGNHEVSSTSALELLALVVSEVADHGLRVGINAVLQNDDVNRREVTEASTGVALVDERGAISNYGYDRNAFAWPFARSETQVPSPYDRPLDTGAAEAVRVVGAAGRLGNDVRVMIADAGFYPNDDFPAYDIVNGLRGVNSVGCGGGTPAPGSNCASHGTHVVVTGFGRMDNDFGTFGPGGEVADLLLLQSPSMDVAGFVRYVAGGLQAFASDPVRIINISASESIPGGLCFLVCEPLDVVIGLLRASNVVVVASAGNDSIDVDAKRDVCFIVFCESFEVAAVIPCELDGVICVGSSTAFQTFRADYSSFGSDNNDNNGVDIYAPGTLYSINALNADEANSEPNDALQSVDGTSYAAPFTSGVLALVMAANPGLNANQAVDCLLGTARRPDPANDEFLAIDALGAVSCAMGGTHPFVAVRDPLDGEVFTRGAESLDLFAVADDYEQGSALDVDWSSSRDGNLGSSTSGSGIRGGLIGLQIGEHEICARANDGTGRTDRDCVTIDVESSPPTVAILQPTSGAEFFESQTINLSASASDLDGPTPTDAQWYLYLSGNPRGAPIASGLNASVSAGIRPPNAIYNLEVSVTDADGVNVVRRTDIVIFQDPVNLPPTVTINDPDNDDTEAFDNAPVRFLINAVANDPEDGAIPFSDIDWEISVQDGPDQAVNLGSQSVCVQFGLVNGQFTCIRFATQYFIDLLPLAGRALTKIEIKPSVEDSGGARNNEENDKVTVFISQLL